jgi:hypothetical protein
LLSQSVDVTVGSDETTLAAVTFHEGIDCAKEVGDGAFGFTLGLGKETT